jgi:hypothetical protein
MFHTGIDPETMKPVQVATRPSDRALRATAIAKRVRATAGRREKIAETEQKQSGANPGALASVRSPNSPSEAGGQKNGHGNSQEEERKQKKGWIEEEGCF